MKKLLSQGLVLAAVLSLTLPPASYAQQSTTVQSTTTTTTTAPGMVTTTSPAIVSQEVIMSSTGAPAGYSLPQLAVVPNSNLEVHLLNFSNQTLTFSSPELKLSQAVPPNSERVIYLDSPTVASLTPGQPVAYYIVDANGNQLASSTVISQPTIASQINTSTTVASTETQTTTSTASTQQSSPEPSNVQQRSTVRGFW